MTRLSIATELATRTAGDRATPSMIGAIANDDELIEIARQDIDAAAKMLTDFAIDTVRAYVAEHRETTRKDAA